MDIDTLIKDLSHTYGRQTVEIGTNFALHFTVEGDDRSPYDHINDCDCYGKVRWDRPNRETGYPQRPSDFTGAAKLLQTYHGDKYWWEPYREGHKVYATTSDQRLVERLMDEGLYYMSLDLTERCSVLGTDGRLVGYRFEEVASAGCGGIDDCDAVTCASFLGEFLCELDIDQEWLDSHSETE